MGSPGPLKTAGRFGGSGASSPRRRREREEERGGDISPLWRRWPLGASRGFSGLRKASKGSKGSGKLRWVSGGSGKDGGGTPRESAARPPLIDDGSFPTARRGISRKAPGARGPRAAGSRLAALSRELGKSRGKPREGRAGRRKRPGGALKA
jgi:hypothetical protein